MQCSAKEMGQCGPNVSVFLIDSAIINYIKNAMTCIRLKQNKPLCGPNYVRRLYSSFQVELSQHFSHMHDKPIQN